MRPWSYGVEIREYWYEPPRDSTYVPDNFSPYQLLADSPSLSGTVACRPLEPSGPMHETALPAAKAWPQPAVHRFDRPASSARICGNSGTPSHDEHPGAN